MLVLEGAGPDICLVRGGPAQRRGAGLCQMLSAVVCCAAHAPLLPPPLSAASKSSLTCRKQLVTHHPTSLQRVVWLPVCWEECWEDDWAG
jgi:hypothetical protein